MGEDQEGMEGDIYQRFGTRVFLLYCPSAGLAYRSYKRGRQWGEGIQGADSLFGQDDRGLCCGCGEL